MAFCCPKSIRPCAYRLTRLDDCDQPVPPTTPSSRYQDAVFMQLDISPDIETGEEILTKLANGDICIHDRDCDRLKGLELTLKVCGSPFPVMELALGVLGLEAENPLDTAGWVLPNSLSGGCPNGLMLEVWAKNASQGACAPIGGDINSPFVEWLFPKTDNWQITDSITFENGAQEITLSGYATNNPNWYPSFPDLAFPSFDAIAGTYTGLPPETLPLGITADPWTLTHQTNIQAGGPLAMLCVEELPDPLVYCDYAPNAAP